MYRLSIILLFLILNIYGDIDILLGKTFESKIFINKYGNYEKLKHRDKYKEALYFKDIDKTIIFYKETNLIVTIISGKQPQVKY
jgi:hypothetical protein